MPQIAESAARLPAAAPQPVPPASSPLHAIGFVLVCVYLFTFYSRVLELTLPRVKIPLVLYIVLILALALSGSALRIFSSRAGMLICAFAGWLLCTVPFAWYKVGSLQASKSMFQTLGLVAAMIAFLRTPRQVVRALYSLAAGSLVAAVLSRLFGSSESGRLAMARGTLADPNEYAMILLIGFPFWLLAARNAKGNPVRKVLALGATIPVLSVLLMTGSRGGAVGLLTVGFLLFLSAPVARKAMVPVAAALVLLLANVVLPDFLKMRYLTFFSIKNADALDEETRQKLHDGAVSSSQGRLDVLIYSLKMTARHPLFGVGPGNFPNVMFAEMTEAGGNRVWLVSHNSYTQVSSETGLPGFVIFAGIMIYSFSGLRGLLKRDAAGRYLYPQETVNAAYYLRISYIALTVCGCFLSFAYVADFYVLAALAVALRLSAPQPAAAVAAAESPFATVAGRALPRHYPKLR